ncbi:uncharacterized protein LOC122078874 isoform X1 [Macadamia integrifolia]|uniref:uncharacterized protein LOC122078874 isoform X1 n=1 Tax=Macadamia integrifolia TaxID=60698 RepID=UPI001C4EC1B9|nr:uncharacterized protein LOC122078874 isoform X1 [Macadamia integrifolia]
MSFPIQINESLRIKYCKLRLLENTSFVSLQAVTLAAVKLSDSIVNALISGSPCLEKLLLECRFVPDSFLLEAPESHLKCIVVNNCFSIGKKFIEHFSVNIPSLQSFKYKGIIKDVSVKNLRNLIDAEIDEQNEYYGFPSHELHMLCELFNGLSHAHVLTLTSWLYIQEETDASYILDKSVLKEPKVWEELTMPLKFLLHLKKVEIKGFEGRGNEIEFLQFLLKNSEVLEKMVISNADLTARYEKYKNKGDKKTLKQLQKTQLKSIQKFFFLRKASPCAEIVLS